MPIKDNIEASLTQLKLKHEEQLKKLEAQQLSEVQSLVSEAKLKFANSLQVTVDHFTIIPDAFKQETLRETGISTLLRALMVTSRKPRASTVGASRTRHGKVTDETIVDAIGNDEMKQSDIATKVGLSEASIGKRLKKLEKLSMRKEGRAQYWRKA